MNYLSFLAKKLGKPPRKNLKSLNIPQSLEEITLLYPEQQTL